LANAVTEQVTVRVIDSNAGTVFVTESEPETTV
jgi:hypothetical protein